MRLSIKTKQVVGVVLLVALAVTALSAIYTALVAGVLLTETQSRGDMLKVFVFERAQRVITSREDAYAALRNDSGLRSLLESSMAYSRHVTYAAIVDPRNVVIVHSSPVLEGQVLEPQAQLAPLLSEDPWTQIQAISSEGTFEVSERLLLNGADGENEFGSIRIGISTALIWEDLLATMRTAVLVGLAALAVTTLVALLLAQWTLRPVHVLQSGFARLGRGEFGVKLDLPAGDEFSELGASFNKLSAELSSVRSQLATGHGAQVESVVDRLEDAVAMVNPDGQIMFANSAIRAALPEAAAGSKLTAWPALHPYRDVVERALATRQSVGPLSRKLTVSGDGEDDETEQWLMAHALLNDDQRFMGVMLVARDLGYIHQVQSTLRYSQKAAALGRLLAGVAHEVKNPLNAMTIHLELLKQKLGGSFAGRGAGRAEVAGVAHGGSGSLRVAEAAPTSVTVDVASVLNHVTVIGAEIKRLDEVVQGFLKFSRPEELTLEPVDLGGMVADVADVVGPQATAAGVKLEVSTAGDLPRVSADSGLLRQALLNLALNAVQAMPSGGVLRFEARRAADRQIELAVSDTGVGISPEHLSRIFDLYFTTREGGSGIGLSMVYRTIQLHDGHIEVQSTPGRGTTFTMRLPQAA
jgi:signal transduction histidine kinase/HAMP domain-containing protein